MSNIEVNKDCNHVTGEGAEDVCLLSESQKQIVLQRQKDLRLGIEKSYSVKEVQDMLGYLAD